MMLLSLNDALVRFLNLFAPMSWPEAFGWLLLENILLFAASLALGHLLLALFRGARDRADSLTSLFAVPSLLF